MLAMKLFNCVHREWGLMKMMIIMCIGGISMIIQFRSWERVISHLCSSVVTDQLVQ